MRKMTKTAVTLAAMSAMTVASASLAFAATNQRDQLNAVGGPETSSNPNSGTWSGSDSEGWTFTPADEVKLANTWAQIDGTWYYFHKDGIMAQDELIYLEGETYYFTPAGAMAVGWYAFDKDSEVLYDYNLVIEDNIDDIHNPVFDNKEDAYETVWLCFNSDGTAKDDEWFQADSGLWYRFDDIVMVCGDFDHEIGNSRYGFDENGAMLVGWANNYNDLMKTAPNKDEDTWYWYESSGKKFEPDHSYNSNEYAFGWKKIDNEWYCFTSSKNDASVGTLIVNAYFTNTSSGTSDYYYVDKKGVMATGIVTVDKDALFINGSDQYSWTEAFKTDTNAKVKKVVDANWDVYFDNNGKAKSDSWYGNRFYANIKSGNVMLFDDDTYTVTGYKDQSVSVTGYKITDESASDLKGALVKKAFITKDDHVYYVDKYGDKVTSSAVQVGYVGVMKTVQNGKDVYMSSSNFALCTDENSVSLGSGEIICKAYIVLDSKGIAYDEIDKDRTVTAGAKKYVSTGQNYKAPDAAGNTTKTFSDAQLFFYYNKN